MSAPEGKSMAELRRLVAESNARFDRIGEVWNDLSNDEQDRLVELAESLTRWESPPEVDTFGELLTAVELSAKAILAGRERDIPLAMIRMVDHVESATAIALRVSRDTLDKIGSSSG
jgi:hypothetical protein